MPTKAPSSSNGPAAERTPGCDIADVGSIKLSVGDFCKHWVAVAGGEFNDKV
jgi:hypothetical protein